MNNRWNGQKVQEDDVFRKKQPFDFTPFDERKFDIDNLHEKPDPIFTLKGKQIATPGNLVNLFAQAKSGKSTGVSCLMAAAMNPGGNGDYLGFSAKANDSGHALFHIDTEQAPYDHDQIVVRALQRAGLSRPPSWLRSYRIKDMPFHIRQEFLKEELSRAALECGGIYSVLIDGTGDLMVDVNDPLETMSLLCSLERYVVEYETVILSVMHENPSGRNDDKPKMRGHIGSYLERKGESNVRMANVPKSSKFVIYCESGRHCHIPRAEGQHFEWDEEERCHISCHGDTEVKSPKKRENNRSEQVFTIFDCVEAQKLLGYMSHGSILNRMHSLGWYKNPEAGRNHFRDRLVGEGWLEKSDSGLYRPSSKCKHDT